MDYINAKRIVHTDISVKNVMIGDGKVAKIIGFGMAKKIGSGCIENEFVLIAYIFNINLIFN